MAVGRHLIPILWCLSLQSRCLFAAHHHQNKDDHTCPLDKEDLDEQEVIKTMGFSFKSPPTTLIEDRAELIANSDPSSHSHTKSCCAPFPLNLWSSLESGIIKEVPPNLGEIATSKTLVEAEKKKRSAASKLRPINTVGPHDRTSDESGLNFWDHGWHYERGSGGCEGSFNVKQELSFAKAPTEGCARHAAILSGPLEDIFKNIKHFEQRVINAAFGDVDVFIYATLSPLTVTSGGDAGGRRNDNSQLLREKQMQFLRSLKSDKGKPYVMAAVIEEAPNASSISQILGSCLPSEKQNPNDYFRDGCLGEQVEMIGTTLKRAIWQGDESRQGEYLGKKGNMKEEDGDFGYTLWSSETVEIERERRENEARDASCCALCKAESKCEFWKRNKKGDCWLMKDALWSVSSSQWRSGVLRPSSNNPVSRLSRAYAQASYAVISSPNGKVKDQQCGGECGLGCWRASIESYLLQSRAMYLGAKLVSRHSARYGCEYGTILLTRPSQKYAQDVSWNAPAQASQAATLFAEHQADEVLAYREQAAVLAIEAATEARRKHLSFKDWDEDGLNTNEEVKAVKARLDNIATVLEAKAKTARDAIRRPPVVIDRPFAGMSKNNKNNKNKADFDQNMAGITNNQQKFPLVFTSTNHGGGSGSLVSGGGGGGYLRSDSQRKHHARPMYRCEVDVSPSRVVLGDAKAIYDLASLYRDFSDWWALLGPRRDLVLCPRRDGISSRMMALQLHWRQLWFLEDGKDLLTPLAWNKFQQQQNQQQQQQQNQQQQQQQNQKQQQQHKHMSPNNLINKKNMQQQQQLVEQQQEGQPSYDQLKEVPDSDGLAETSEQFPIVVSRAKEAVNDMDYNSYSGGNNFHKFDNGFTFTSKTNTVESSGSDGRGGGGGLRSNRQHEEFVAQWRRRLQRKSKNSGVTTKIGEDNDVSYSAQLIMKNINAFSEAPPVNDDEKYELYAKEEKRKELERIEEERKEKEREIEEERKEAERIEAAKERVEREREANFDVAKHFELGRELAFASAKKTPPNTYFNATLWDDFIATYYKDGKLLDHLLVPTNTDRWLTFLFPNASKTSPPTSPLLKKTAALAFIHIPKTGGSTLVSVLDALARDRAPLCYRRFMYTYEKEPTQHSGSECDPENGFLVFGHNSYDPTNLANLRLYNPLTPIYHMVFLREPLSRIVSFSNFNEEPLSNWLNPAPYFGWQRYAINAMTGMINGVVGIGPGIGPNYLYPSDERSCAFNPVKDSKAVAYAKHQLVNVYSFVGDTANFEESVWLLYQTFGWPESYILFALGHSKRLFDRGGKHRPGWSRWGIQDISPQLQKVIRDVEVCDCEVYSFASQLVKNRVSVLPPPLKANLQRFKAKLEREATRPSSLLYNAD